jgi:hypothetical protein
MLSRFRLSSGVRFPPTPAESDELEFCLGDRRGPIRCTPRLRVNTADNSLGIWSKGSELVPSDNCCNESCNSEAVEGAASLKSPSLDVLL